MRSVGAERMHERTSTRVTPRLRQRMTVHVAGASAERQRPVRDPSRGVGEVGLGRLHLGEHRLGGVERRITGWERGVVRVDHRRRPVEHGAHRGEIDHVLREAHRGVRVGGDLLGAPSRALRRSACGRLRRSPATPRRGTHLTPGSGRTWAPNTNRSGTRHGSLRRRGGRRGTTPNPMPKRASRVRPSRRGTRHRVCPSARSRSRTAPTPARST